MANLIFSFVALLLSWNQGFWLEAYADVKEWHEPAEPFQIAGPIYYVGTKGLAVYLLKSTDGLILISGAMPGSEGHIASSIRKLGFKLEDVRLMLTSHAHVDHVGTHAALKKMTGAKILAMAGDKELLESGGKKDYLFANKLSFHFASVVPDRLVKDGEKLSLGNIQLTAHATPGHTKGCTTWETNIEVDGKRYNVLFPDGTSVNPGTSFGKNPSYPGIAQDYRRSFEVLQSLQPDIFLSYHAEFFDLKGKRQRMAKEGVKVWIDPKGYKSLIQRKKAEFEKLLKKDNAL